MPLKARSAGASTDLVVARQRYLEHVRSWAFEHQGFLDIIFGEFYASGEWPDVNRLQRTRSRVAANDVDLIDIAGKIPILIGIRDYADNRVSLSLRGMSTCSQAAELMGSFVRAVKLCYGLWSGSSDPPKIDGDALRDHLGLAGTAVGGQKLIRSGRRDFCRSTAAASPLPWRRRGRWQAEPGHRRLPGIC